LKGCATVITDPELAAEFVDQLGVDLQDQSCSVEVRSLGRTIVRWRDQIVAWHQALVTNGAAEATNNLINASSGSASGSAASPTTASEYSSTPAAQLRATRNRHSLLR
jgi:hypothetical protein